MQTRTTKTCKVCGIDFEAWSQAQRLNRFCGPVCAARWGAYQRDRKRDAANRKELAKRKEALKTLGQWTKEAQSAVNLYIRERDKAKPCIVHGHDCPHSSGGFHAGHFLSVGSHPELRFNTWNIHKQCAVSNQGSNKYARFSRDSHIAAHYEKQLRSRIGDDRVDMLKGPHKPKQYRIDDLKRIRRIFNRRARHYKKLRDMRDGH